MRLAYIFLANYADVMSDGRFTIVGADFNTMATPMLPIVLPFFYVVGKAYFTPDEVEQDVSFRLRILDPHGNELPQPHLDIPLHPTDNNDPDFPTSLGVSIVVQALELREAGIYRVIVQLGILPEVEIPFRIHLVQPHP
jgi:hypothetical protein